MGPLSQNKGITMVGNMCDIEGFAVPTGGHVRIIRKTQNPSFFTGK